MTKTSRKPVRIKRLAQEDSRNSHSLFGIPELYGLVDTSRGSRWYCCAIEALVCVHICLDGGVTTRVDDLAADHLGDLSGSKLPQSLSLRNNLNVHDSVLRWLGLLNATRSLRLGHFS